MVTCKQCKRCIIENINEKEKRLYCNSLTGEKVEITGFQDILHSCKGFAEKDIKTCRNCEYSHWRCDAAGDEVDWFCTCGACSIHDLNKAEIDIPNICRYWEERKSKK